jgi:hypothetical protein
VSESSPSKKPLSERPLGYGIAVLGGLLGAPLGLLASPGVLFLLNKTMQGKEDKRPNRFAAWALIGIIGAPISLAVSNPGFRSGYEKGYSEAKNEKTQESNDTEGTSQEAGPTSVSAGDFTLSNVRIEPYKGDTKGADVAGELWAVYADVKNDSKETKVPGYSMSTEVIDSEGRKYKSADFVVTSNAIVDEAFGGEKVTRFTDGILPGSTRTNVQVGVFDVTKGAKDLRLCAGGLFSGTTCIGG